MKNTSEPLGKMSNESAMVSSVLHTIPPLICSLPFLPLTSCFSLLSGLELKICSFFPLSLALGSGMKK
jgi:hypothetical protein